MAEEKTLLIKNVQKLVTCDKEDDVLEGADVFVRGGRIESIGWEDHKEADEVIDASHMVLYPGLINTHHHLYQAFSRNLPEVQNMELFSWLTYLYEIWKRVDPEVIYYSALTALGELLKNGCTTCLDHLYVFPGGGSGLLDADFAAADALGIRLTATRGSMDLGVREGGLPPDSLVQSVDEILRDSEEAVAQFHDRDPFAMHQVALAPCSPFSVSKELLEESAKLARHLGVRLHTHLVETKDEEAFTMENYGMRPLEYMESLGWLGDDVWFAHGIYFNDEELQRLADTGTGIAHCPISNMKLSSGIARVPEMLEMGIPVGLGVDGSASNDGSNLLEEMRVAYLLHRLNSSHKAPDGYQILKMATSGGARLLGREKLGQIAPGMAADFFLVDLNRLELIGTQFDVASLLCTVGLKGSVDYTVVGGNVVVREGHLTGIDEEKTAGEANRVVERYLDRLP